MHKLTGSIVALVTPMLENGNVDYDSLQNLVEYHIQSGTKAIVSVGTTGESPTLIKQEHAGVIKKTIEFVKGRIPVIAGIGSNSTAQTIGLSQELENQDVAAFLLVVPYYNKPTQEGLYQHFKAIAENTKHDILLYNVPGRTIADLQPETVARLSEIKNIIGIKEATGDVSRVAKIKASTPDDFLLLSGDDGTAYEFLKLGGHGVISVANNIIAKDFAMLCQAALSKDFNTADAINSKYKNLYNLIFKEANPIPIKWACYKMGLIKTPVLRLPLTALSSNIQDELTQELKLLELI